MTNDKSHVSSKYNESTEKFLLTSRCMEFLKDHPMKTRTTLVIQALRDSSVDRDMKHAMIEAFALLAKNEGIGDVNKVQSILKRAVFSSGDTLAKILSLVSLITATFATLTMAGLAKLRTIYFSNGILVVIIHQSTRIWTRSINVSAA